MYMFDSPGSIPDRGAAAGGLEVGPRAVYQEAGRGLRIELGMQGVRGE